MFMGVVSFVVVMKVWSLTLYHKREDNALFKLIFPKIQDFRDILTIKNR